MLHKLRISLFGLIAFGGLLPANAFAQGDNAFLRGQGNLDVVFSYSRESFDEYFLGDSPFAPSISGSRRELYSIYGAYGLTDNIDLFASASYIDSQSDAEIFQIDDEASIQDLAFGAKFRLFERRAGKGAFSFVAAPALKVPLDDYVTFEENPINAPGQNQVDLRLRLIGQYQFDKGHWFALESGYDVRFEEPADEVPINATFGFNIHPRVTLTPFYSRSFSVGDDDFNNSFSTSGVSFERYGLGSFIQINDSLGLTGSWRITDEGRNESEGFTAGLVLRF